MGMYTAIKFSAALSDVGRAVVSFIDDVNHDETIRQSPWLAAAEHFEFSWLGSWAKEGRSDFIPWGFYSPGGRDIDDVGHQHTTIKPKPSSYLTSGYVSPELSTDGKTWHVCTELKNYNNEISKFCENVLPHLIAEPCTVYCEYEERRYAYDDPTPEYVTDRKSVV